MLVLNLKQLKFLVKIGKNLFIKPLPKTSPPNKSKIIFLTGEEMKINSTLVFIPTHLCFCFSEYILTANIFYTAILFVLCSHYFLTCCLVTLKVKKQPKYKLTC